MCPACIATAAWIAAGTASAGGISVLAMVKFKKQNDSKKAIQYHPKNLKKHHHEK